MTKTTLFKNLTYIVVGIVLAVGVSYLYAATGSYSDPSGTPPTGNTATPLNIGTTAQVKTGGLSIEQSFLANQNAAFNKQAFFNGLMLGGTASTDGTLAFGSSKSPASIQVSGDLNTSNAMQSSTLKNSSGNSGICANAAGQVVLCNIDVCSNITGTQLTVPTGDVSNSNGTCSPATKEFLAVLQSIKDYKPSGYVGNVVNDGDLTMHDPNVNNQGYGYPSNGTEGLYLPLVDSIGLDNDDSAGWLINQIPGVQGNQLAENASPLLNVVEAGSYAFNIQYSGQFSAAGKSTHNDQYFGVDFYMQIHHKATDTDTYVPLDTAKSNYNHENYPINGDLNIDYGGTDSSDTFVYVPYSFTFAKTYTLQPGDQVTLHAYLYGVSGKTGFFATNGDFFNSAGDYKNFSFDVQAFTGSKIDIVETPSQ